MKWLLDLIWPKAPVTMEEVGSSRADVPVENLKPPAWKTDSPRSTVVKELLVAFHEAGDNQRAVRLLMSLVAAFQQVDVPLDTATLFGPMGNGDYFVTFAQSDRRLTFTVCVDDKDSGWHSLTKQSYGRSVDNGPLPSNSHELVKVLLHHLGARVATDADASKWRPMLPPDLVLGPSDTVTVSNGPVVPEVESLARQVVSLREEVARVKVEAMQAILEARHEAARDAADWRGERDALSLRVNDVEGTENQVVNALHELDRRLERIEASFPVGWSTSAWYTKKAGDVWLNVSDRRTGWFVSVTSAREDQSGCLESGPHKTMVEAVKSAERLGEQLRVEMEDRTVIGESVVTRKCSEVDGV